MPLRHGAERPCTRDNLQGRLEHVGSQRGGCLELGVAEVHRRYRSWTGCPSESKGRVLRTAHQQDRDPVELLIGLLRASAPGVADLRIPGHR